jgi:hypothetical protein
LQAVAPRAASGPGFISASSPGGRSLGASFQRPTTSSSTSSSAAAAGSSSSSGPGAPGGAKAPSKPRLPSLDSLRFFLIAYIGVGHFVAFATKDAFLVKLFSQV